MRTKTISWLWEWKARSTSLYSLHWEQSSFYLLFLFGCLGASNAQGQTLPGPLWSNTHQIELERHLQIESMEPRSEADWSLLSGFGALASLIPLFSTSSISYWEKLPSIFGKPLVFTGKVYAYFPFWMGTAWEHYDLSEFSRLLYFAYAVDPLTGKSRHSMDAWEASGLQHSANQKGCQVDLVLALYGHSNIDTFLNRPYAQEQLILEVLALLKEKGNGINLDFFPVSPQNQLEFTRFALRLALKLKAENPQAKFSLTLAPDQGSLDQGSLLTSQLIDQVYLKTYDPPGKGQNQQGLTLSEKQINRITKKYIVAGLPRKKLTWLLPYFAEEWNWDHQLKSRTHINRIHTLAFAFPRFYARSQVLPNKGGTVFREPRTKGSSKSPYILWEGIENLKEKVQVVSELRTNGIGFWAMGYERSQGINENWINLLPEYPDTTEISSIDSNKTDPAADKQKAEENPLGFIPNGSPEALRQFYWISVDSFHPVLRSPAEELLILSPDIPLPQRLTLAQVIVPGLFIWAVFFLLGWLSALLAYEFRVWLFNSPFYRANIYFALLWGIALVLVLATGVKLPWWLAIFCFISFIPVSFLLKKNIADIHTPQS